MRVHGEECKRFAALEEKAAGQVDLQKWDVEVEGRPDIWTVAESI